MNSCEFKNKFNKATRCVASTKVLPQPFLLHASYVTKAGKSFLELTAVHSGLRGLLAVTVSSNQRREYRQQGDPVERPLKPLAERPAAM